MCYRAVRRYFFALESIPYQYKTQEIYDIVVPLYPFLTAHFPDKIITQNM